MRPLQSSREPSTGLARALSKLGFCSRSEAWKLIKSGRVRIEGVVYSDPETPVRFRRARIEVDGQIVNARKKIYLMLNKPRGLITSASYERGRATVFQCLGTQARSEAAADRNFRKVSGGIPPHVFPVGRLDKASEGLLLFTNDTSWAAQITAPESRVQKTYHVQVNCVANEEMAHQLESGLGVDGEILAAKRVGVLRVGAKNSWIEVVLDEGKNRHIRRLLAVLNIGVLRLVRVAIGALPLGALAKGDWRYLTAAELRACLLNREGEGF